MTKDEFKKRVCALASTAVELQKVGEDFLPVFSLVYLKWIKDEAEREKKEQLDKAFAAVEAADIKPRIFWKDSWLFKVDDFGKITKEKCSKKKFMVEFMHLSDDKTIGELK